MRALSRDPCRQALSPVGLASIVDSRWRLSTPSSSVHAAPAPRWPPTSPFQTDDDLLLVAAGPPLSALPAWKGRFEEAYMDAVRASPVTAAIVEGNKRATDLLGVLKLRYFFREAAG